MKWPISIDADCPWPKIPVTVNSEGIRRFRLHGFWVAPEWSVHHGMRWISATQASDENKTIDALCLDVVQRCAAPHSRVPCQIGFLPDAMLEAVKGAARSKSISRKRPLSLQSTGKMFIIRSKHYHRTKPA